MDSTVLARAPSLRTSLAGRPPNISPAHEHVGEGVDVGGQEAVDVEGEVVAGRLVAGDPVGVPGVAGREHVVLDRVGVLGQGLGGQVVGQADRLAGTHQAGGGARRASVRWLSAPRWSSAPNGPSSSAPRTWRRGPRWSGPRTRSPWAQLVSRRRWGAVIAPITMSTRLSTNRSSERTSPAGPRGRGVRARSAAARPMKAMQISRRTRHRSAGTSGQRSAQQVPGRVARRSGPAGSRISGRGPVDGPGHLRADLEVGPLPPPPLGELGDGADDGLGRRPDVLGGRGPGLLQQLVPALGDGRDVPGQHGPQDLVAAAEVVVDGRGVALVGGPHDLGQGDVVDAPLGEEPGAAASSEAVPGGRSGSAIAGRSTVVARPGGRGQGQPGRSPSSRQTAWASIHCPVALPGLGRGHQPGRHRPDHVGGAPALASKPNPAMSMAMRSVAMNPGLRL